jgi:CDP-glucose 4,6-dehydratase
VVVRNPDAVRPWQHVLEPLAGYLRLGEALLRDGHAAAGAWNFGPAPGDGALTVRWVVERFIEEWGAGSWATPERREAQPHEAQQLRLDSAKAGARLGWAPLWRAPEAVRRSAVWYRGYHEDPRESRRLLDEDLSAYAAAIEAAAATPASEGAPS